MSQLCDHGYHPQRLGDGPCDLCADIAGLKAQLSATEAKLAEAERERGELRLEVARLLLATPGGQAKLREEILAYDFEDKEGA